MRRLPFALSTTVAFLAAASVLQAQSIDPATYSATMTVGQTITINKTITLGASGANLVDIFFLGDNTGSMGGEITNMKNGASAILANVPAGASYYFGVGEYNSDPSEYYGTAPFYAENQGLTSDTDLVQAAINGWSAGGGGDTPEANFYALQQMANNADWRTGSQRIAIWFGDAPSHTATTTQAEALAALQANGVTVIGFNSASAGSGIDQYGQATAITDGTGGTLVHGFNTISTSAFVTAVNSEISTATSTLDLAFGSTFSGTGLTLEFICTDAEGCDDVAGGESRDFQLRITANEVGVYDFSVFARGVDATEVDRIVVTDGGGVSVPEPGSLLLIATGLLGFAVRTRRDEKEA